MKKVRRFVVMKNPIEGKPKKFNQHQGLEILALEGVNTPGRTLSDFITRPERG